MLSFAIEGDFEHNILGAVVISLDTAKVSAATYKTSLENELRTLFLHGVLHLLGYDHETDNGEMSIKELMLQEEFNIKSLIQRTKETK